MNNRIGYYIRILLLMLLLVWGSIGDAWADKTVTYHVITLEFGEANLTYSEGDSPVKYRIEAIRQTVTCADDAVIELPAQLKSPLMTDGAYTYYYTGVTISDKVQIFPNNPSKFDTYTFDTEEALAANKKISELGAAGSTIDIYVTYDKWLTKVGGDYTYRTELGKTLDINGGKTYNIEFKSGSNSWFFAMNMNSERGNRAQAIPTTDIGSLHDLTTDGPHKLKNGLTNETKTDFHYTWKLLNNDPYNIILETAYGSDIVDPSDFGSFDYAENNYPKKSRHARFYGRVNSKTDVEKNSWMSNEWGYGWDKDNGGTPTKTPGWFRGINLYGIGTNGVADNLYFSFTLLKRTAAEKDFTLVASWANVSDHNWVPNDSKHYLHLGRKATTKYPGPGFSTFEAADQVIFHEIRDYTFKVKTPFYQDDDPNKADHVVSTSIKWSDYAASTLLVDSVPADLRRRYVTFNGTYKDIDLDGKENNSISTFTDAAANGGTVWVKYTSTIPFDVGGPSASLDGLTSYNVYANNEERYVTWYDSPNFKTNNGGTAYSIYDYNSQFSFIGDPYELYVINVASAGADTPQPYLALHSTYNEPLIASSDRTIDNSWEIVNDEKLDDNINKTYYIRLRKYKSLDTEPKYLSWNTGLSTYPLNGNTDKSQALWLMVKKLPMMTYNYYIIDKFDNSASPVIYPRIADPDGGVLDDADVDYDYPHIAVMASERQPIGNPLNLDAIPEVIRSPFLAGATLNFWTYTDDTMETLTELTLDKDKFTNTDPNNEWKNHIFVSYTTSPAYTSVIDNVDYNVIVNNLYIYYDKDEANPANAIKGKANFNAEGDSPSGYGNLWRLSGSNPYAMTIKNLGVGTPGTGKYMHVADWDVGTNSWVDTEDDATRFIVKQGSQADYHEVMATTGVVRDASYKIDAANSVDASVTYYNFGRPDVNTVKMFSNAVYEHGYSEIRFQLKKSTAKQVMYHLIDLSNKILLSEPSRQAEGDKPRIPAEYFSPLVDTYTYWKDNPITNGSADKYGSSEVFGATPPDDVYITYTTDNSKVDLHHTTMYLMKFAQGTPFYQENGSDGLLTDEEFADENISKPVYPYCNGDCNFNIYGQYQYDLQQEGAASTRTRWAWYLESGNNDPYHVNILSRQTEIYDGMERTAYFATIKPTDFDGDATNPDGVVTTLVWPNISGVLATDYMVLGSDHQYQLVTTNPITVQIDKNGDGDFDDSGDVNKEERYVVNTLEQYWKTYDLIKKRLLSDLLPYCFAKDQTDNPTGSIEVPTEPASLRARLTGTGEGQYGFHSYNKMAYAKRWNGYNAAGEKKKGWETREHWFSTVKMGSGYFDLIPTTIDPALILLDQHGWEIMRKPIPSSPDEDPAEKARKYAAISAYDSPMVKEYIFWSSAKKRSGFHQYYMMDKRIGGDYTSATLTQLPPFDSENVHDTKGNLNDQYVTYIVKEEYAMSYNPDGQTAEPFLIRQGDILANNSGTSSVGSIDVSSSSSYPGGVSEYIIRNIASLNRELWYIKPNVNIDTEMGYTSSNHSWTAANADNPNAYDDAAYSKNRVAGIIEGASDDPTVVKYGRFTFSNGFDPYNIQIVSNTDTRYFTLGMTRAEMSEGVAVGDYSGGSTNVRLDSKQAPVESNGTGYDNSKWYMTNQTLMAVLDADGNMQLMPRFDHQLRMRSFNQLVTLTAEAEDPDKLKETYTQLYRPFVYNYRIIDNTGHESLRYQSGGELVPQTPSHLKSPFAKDFKYYKDLTQTAGIYNLTDIDSKEITASMAGAGMSTPSVTTANPVYVRYTYDAEADNRDMLLGKWFTMQLNGLDAIFSSGIKQASASKPTPVVGTTNREWQWKFLKHSYSDPDPYAVQLYNRLADNKDKPLSVDGSTLSIQTDGADGYYQHFALLSHSDTDSDGKPDTYALAVAGTGNYTYTFLNGHGMTTSVAAVIAEDKADYSDPGVKSGFTSTSGTFHDNDSRIQLFDDVNDTYHYKVHTNAKTFAVQADQTTDEVVALDNDFAPSLPNDARSPLLNLDQYVYYEAEADMDITGKELHKLYGLYDGDVYVRYTNYDPKASEYKVPNEKTTENSHVAGAGNRSSLQLNGILPYNIVWYNDNMMGSSGTTISDGGSQDLNGNNEYVWQLDGNDPYAIQIKHKNSGKYADGSSTLSGSSTTTFMLLNKEDYEQGVLQVTGNTNKQKLTGYGHDLTPDAATDPNEFIIFALATNDVIYHLVIKNVGSKETIPWRAKSDESETKQWNTVDAGYNTGWLSSDVADVDGTTIRDLTSYALADQSVGPVSLGDELTVPELFYRPNVVYTFYVKNIQKNTGGDTWVNDDDLNDKYKGMEITSEEMGTDGELIGKRVYINITYGFNKGLEANRGDNFVLSINENKWYTLETQIDDTPYLAQYTNAWGFELKEGQGSHYTNDFLWTPIGDPYGFQLFNRYMDINSGNDNRGEKDKVITTEGLFCDNETLDGGTPAERTLNGETVFMGNYIDGGQTVIPGKPTNPSADADEIKKYSIYELLDGGIPGYFYFHPVANTSEPKFYLNPVNGKDKDDADHIYVRLTKVPTPFTFGLSKDLLKPYFDRAGYVGGLRKEVYNANPELVAAMKDGAEATAEHLRTAQVLVYDLNNVVPFKTGYYRLHSPLGISDIEPVRYVSGYTHAIERDLNGDGNESDAIPMHFYEENSEQVRSFTDLKNGFTNSNATRGDIPILPVERDPASIFYFTAIYDHPEDPGTELSPNPDYRNNLSYISSEGLYVRGVKGRVVYTGIDGGGNDVVAKSGNIEGTHERAAAVMTNNAPPSLEVSRTRAANPATLLDADPAQLFVMDIGGGILLIHDNETNFGRKYLKYFCYDHSFDEDGEPTIYDMKLTHNTHTDHAKFCMQPVQQEVTPGVNEMGLKLKMNKGGDGYYYASFCAPFDVLLTDEDNDAAYISLVWDTEILHLKNVGRFNTIVNGCPAGFVGSNQFVPAGTPVIIRSNNANVTMALPTTEPSTSLTTNFHYVHSEEDDIVSNIFSGSYLERLLAEETGSNDVYVFGVPVKGVVSKDANYSATGNSDNGKITIVLPQTAESGVGFYINANPNREAYAAMGGWVRNNRYVYNNRIYVRNGVGGGIHAPRKQETGVQFIPVVFDGDEDDASEDMTPHGPMDNHVYDLQGRCVATPQQVESGNWQSQLSPGIYILNGRKVRVPSR